MHAMVRPGSDKLPSGGAASRRRALDEATSRVRSDMGHRWVHSSARRIQSVQAADSDAWISRRSRPPCAARGRAPSAPRLREREHPAPSMHAYIAVRQEGEALGKASGIRATFCGRVTSWAGPWWPYLLFAAYAVARWFPRLVKGRSARLVTRVRDWPLVTSR